MYWHIETDIVCLAFVAAMYFALMKNARDTTTVGACFSRSVAACGITLLVDIAASVVMEIPVPSTLLIALMTVYYAILLLGLCTWTQYCFALIYEETPKKTHVANLAVGAVYIAYVVYVIANLFTGWIFYVDESGYHRGAAFNATYVIYGCWGFMLMLFVLIKWEAIKRPFLRFLLLFMPLLLAVGIYVQIMNPGWLTIVPSFAAMLFAAFLFIQNDWSRRLLAAKQEELRLAAEVASRDSITGLLNHGTAVTHIETYLRSSAAFGENHALFIINLDNFAQLNEVLGKEACDDILAEAARRIKRCFRESDVVARIGGDEFMVMMKRYGKTDIVRRKARELLDALQLDCGKEGIEAMLTVSIGIGLHNGDGTPLQTLHVWAQDALTRAKAAGKNGYAIYSGEVENEINVEHAPTIHVQTMLEQMDGGIILAEIGSKLKITYVSPSYYTSLVVLKNLSRAPNDVIKHIYPADRDSVFSACHKAAESGETVEHIYRVGRTGNDWRFVRLTRLTYSGAGPVPLIGVITNISQLKTSDMILDGLFKNIPTGICVYEINRETGLRALYHNEQAVAINGLKPEVYAASTENVTAAVHPDDMPQLQQKLEEARNGASFDIIYRNNPDLCIRPRYINARGTILLTQTKNPLLLIAFTMVREL